MEYAVCDSPKFSNKQFHFEPTYWLFLVAWQLVRDLRCTIVRHSQNDNQWGVKMIGCEYHDNRLAETVEISTYKNNSKRDYTEIKSIKKLQMTARNKKKI